MTLLRQAEELDRMLGEHPLSADFLQALTEEQAIELCQRRLRLRDPQGVVKFVDTPNGRCCCFVVSGNWKDWIGVHLLPVRAEQKTNGGAK